MELLAKKVGLEAQENLCTLDLPKIKALRSHFLGISHHRIDIGPYEISKRLCGSNDFLQYFLLLRLKGQSRDLSLPILKVFKLGASCVTRDLDAIIAYRASVIVVFFDFASSDFEAFAMVPVAKSVDTHLGEYRFSHHS